VTVRSSPEGADVKSNGYLLHLLCLLVACSSDAAGPTANAHADWKEWIESFIVTDCNHSQVCVGDVNGARCHDVAVTAADQASCDNAVAFYLAHRSELEACTRDYPSTCPVTIVQACPLLKDFDSLCP
jgi:hypothetical protein